MFKKVLIANRGEIAVRVIRTCREMGIVAVAVYSEADKTALHVLEADEAVYLGPAEPLQSYLNIGRLLEAARKTGAEAVHPGYGFLAENPELAEGCRQAGVVFIGPPAQAIRDLGSKTKARTIMAQAGVPVIPGLYQTSEDLQVFSQEAERLGYPVLIKAAAGGGGKGMRIISAPGELAEAFQSCKGEAEKAFGDGALYLEKHLKSPRHVEFQILADSFGNVVHLFERECSIQRRHQKIIEETPSPALTPALRREMGQAAVAAARASGYVNAGTVEFLLDREGNFYFLEVNTRLQVEHPITEVTTGLDLVRQQLEIAAGQALPFRQEEIRPRGHAFECRIYAEDPEDRFFPSPGRILYFQEPSGPGIRLDSGIRAGFDVPVDYDPILGKLIVLAENREAARRRMIRALENTVILGINTTIPFLLDVFKTEEFRAGKTRTDFIDRHFESWQPDRGKADLARIAFAAAKRCPLPLADGERAAALDRPSPWQTLGEWRL
ncbi:MAG: acetyl-CoA carboxylase biotin carboxylase subunit [Deltaproteobacteria bacterium]|nr:acetyl-CoA carboxylase biotin carboxylase subunit [Deltaproteobacteria bacterium]